jgi:predicted hydrocarbon binding protein
MEQIITKETAQKLLETRGNLKGIAIKDDFDYVFHKEGEEGVKKLEEELENLGYPIKHEDIKIMNLYPVGLESVIMLACKKVFNFDDKEFGKLGQFSSKLPLIIRLFMKYFVSLEAAAKEAPMMWRRYYTIGDLKVKELNKEKKYLIIELKNFSVHPIYYLGLEGYFIGITSMILKKSVTCQKTKCVHQGIPHYEFLLKW